MFDLHTRAGLIAVVVVSAAVSAAPASAKKPAKNTPRQVSGLVFSGMAGLSGAQQLAAISEQTAGGHLAIINGQRYVRMPDGSLVSV